MLHNVCVTQKVGLFYLYKLLFGHQFGLAATKLEHFPENVLLKPIFFWTVNFLHPAILRLVNRTVKLVNRSPAVAGGRPENLRVIYRPFSDSVPGQLLHDTLVPSKLKRSLLEVCTEKTV